MSEEESKVFHPADTNGDGKVTAEEEAMYLEFKRKELEDQDAMRDAQRNMTWFALGGLLLYPFAVVIVVVLLVRQESSSIVLHISLFQMVSYYQAQSNCICDAAS